MNTFPFFSEFFTYQLDFSVFSPWTGLNLIWISFECVHRNWTKFCITLKYTQKQNNIKNASKENQLRKFTKEKSSWTVKRSSKCQWHKLWSRKATKADRCLNKKSILPWRKGNPIEIRTGHITHSNWSPWTKIW